MQSATHQGGTSRDGQINFQTNPKTRLIWLDADIAAKKKDYQNITAQMSDVANTFNTFIDEEQCAQFLNNTMEERVYMIISGTLTQNIVPRIHNMPQLVSIFVFCDTRQHYERWAKAWFKIQGFFTEIKPLCEAIKQVASQYDEYNFLSNSMNINGKSADISLHKLPPYIYSKILIEMLMNIEFESHSVHEFAQYCRKNFDLQRRRLQQIVDFEQSYDTREPIYWYTSQSFLSSMINHALRTMDVDLIIKLGFFICDLHRQIERLHKTQFSSYGTNQRFTLYRGQGMLKEEFKKMTANIGGLLSFNTFLSTVIDRQVALFFIESSTDIPDWVGILFVINIDPARFSTPFASIEEASYFSEEKEVLFAPHTIFRIDNVSPIPEDGHLVQIELTAVNDNADCDLIKYIREETFPDDVGWIRVGAILVKMGKFYKAEQVYEVLLKQTIEKSVIARIYNQLGMIKVGIGEYSKALAFYEKSIAIEQGLSPINHRNLVTLHNNIGNVHECIGEYPGALLSHEKALEIQQQLLPPTHPDFALTYIYLAEIHLNLFDYSRALSLCEKALTIQEQSLFQNHPDFASTYICMGKIYLKMANYSKALSFCEKALTIQGQSLFPNHPEFASTCITISNVYFNLADYPKGISACEKALTTQEQSLPLTHPAVALTRRSLGKIYLSIGEYSKALSSCEEALEIQQKSLPPTHPDLALTYISLGKVYLNMKEYSRALSSCDKALAIQQKSLPPSHPDLALSNITVGTIYLGMANYLKAHSYFTKALLIQQQSLPLSHPDLALTHDNIGLVHNGLMTYTKARLAFELAIDIAQRLLPSNHPDLEKYREHLAEVNKKP